MHSFPPRHLCIVGALWIAAGVGAAAEVVAELLHGRVDLNLALLALPVGFGILSGSTNARQSALFLASLGLAFTVGGGGLMAYEHWSGKLPLAAPFLTSALVEVVLTAACCLYVLLALTRSEHLLWFTDSKEERPAVRSLAWAVVVVAALSSTSEQLTAWQLHETYEKAAEFRVKVTPYDAVSGRGIESLSFGSNDTPPKPVPETRTPPKVDCSFVLEEGGGRSFKFRGEAAQPFEVTLHAKGYQDKVITLCGKAEYDIRVPMQPLEDGKDEEAGGNATAPGVNP